jgi:hypothetical protein
MMTALPLPNLFSSDFSIKRLYKIQLFSSKIHISSEYNH